MISFVDKEYYCEECGSIVRLYNDDVPLYCPYCGTLFDHEKDMRIEELDYEDEVPEISKDINTFMHTTE